MPEMPKRSPVTMTSRRTGALARRLAPGGKIFAGGSMAIPLKEPGWQVRTFNSDLHESRHYQAIHELGWEPVRAEDLSAAPEQFGLRVNETGALVRGTRGNELICKMPSADYQQLQMKKTEYNNRSIGRSERTKDEVANHVASVAGDEGGQYVKDHFVGTVRDVVAPLTS
jgi:hypothetical protein